MSATNQYYFVCLQPQHQPTDTDLTSQYQAFQAWLQRIEGNWAHMPTPLSIQYQPNQLLLIWPTNITLLALINILAQLGQHSYIAINQGTAIYDPQRQWYYSHLPAQLNAFIEVGKHHQHSIIIGEQASQVLPQEQLTYLTRSYFAGATTALEVYAWE
ncbi:MAG: hypothetical protein AB8E82_00320 [Aureispira sp.]